VNVGTCPLDSDAPTHSAFLPHFVAGALAAHGGAIDLLDGGRAKIWFAGFSGNTYMSLDPSGVTPFPPYAQVQPAFTDNTIALKRGELKAHVGKAERGKHTNAARTPDGSQWADARYMLDIASVFPRGCVWQAGAADLDAIRITGEGRYGTMIDITLMPMRD
jgi:hypothetical protein